MKQKLRNTIFVLFLALFFITPLIFTRNTSELYEMPKMFFMYLIGALILCLFVITIVLYGKRSFSKPNKYLTLYVLLLCISTVFSSHLYTSLWGYYTRFNDGLISNLLYFGLYIVGINFFDQEKKEKFIDAVMLSAVPISLYAIIQAFTTDRVFSTFGQPNWLAAYFIFLIPLYIEKIKKREQLYLWAVSLLLVLVSLILTASLSGLLGLLVVLVLLLNKKAVLYLLPIGLLAFVLNFAYLKDRISDAFTFSADPSSYIISDSSLIRLGLWQGALKISSANTKNFIIGIGPETFPYEFPFYRADFLNYSSEWDFILNKPHNYFLEILTETGVLSLIVYILVLINFCKTKNRYMIAGFVGFAVTNLFGWPTVYTGFLFWMWLAFAEISDKIDQT